MRNRRFAVVLLLFVAALSSSSVATWAPPSLSKDDGVFLLRVVLGLEVAAPSGDGYRSLPDLVHSRDWPRDRFPIEVVDSASAPVRDYTLRLTLADDRRHFQAALKPTDSTHCSWAVFTDEDGVIYPGKGLGCN